MPAIDLAPKLRPLDVRPQIHNGQPYVLLRDPLQLSENSLLIPQTLAAVLSFCDGTRNSADMASAFSSVYGISIPHEVVAELIAALDDTYLLDNERSTRAKDDILDSFRTAPFRPALLAGSGYPAGAGELGEELDAYLSGIEQDRIVPDLASASVAGLLSPHIDYTRGGATYAQIWRYATSAVRDAELVIVFGTDHYGADPLTLTRQSYATPYGILPTATSIVDEIANLVGEDRAFAGELRHRGEHSLELVLVWLHHMRQGNPVEIVPILCGGLHRYIQNGDLPSADGEIRALVELLARASSDRKVLVVASGDMAHVGPAFGGAPLDGRTRAAVRKSDNELLAYMRRGDPDGFFTAIQRTRDRHNVCGVAPVYLALRLLRELCGGDIQGYQTGYAECPADGQNTSAVTIAGVYFAGA